MPLQNGAPLPHEGRARYPLANSRMVLIDLDDQHVVIEVHKDHLTELPHLDQTFTLKAGDLRFFYYRKTPDTMRFLDSMKVNTNSNTQYREHTDHSQIDSTKASGSLASAESKSTGPEQLKTTIDHIRETGHLPDGSRSCLLCDDTCPNEAMLVGVFTADRDYQRRIGYPAKKLAKGGRRFVLYQRCPSCYERPSRDEEVDTKIMSRLGVQ
jgi:hypothetical protein